MENKHYFLTRAISDPKIIGVRNGVHQGGVKWIKFAISDAQKQYEAFYSLQKYRENKNTVEEFDFPIEYVEAYGIAKLTDFFSFTPRLWGINFLVSTKVKDILSKFELPAHSFVSSNVFLNGTRHEYWGFYLPTSYREDSIDFQGSTFKKEIGFQKFEIVKVNTVEDFKSDLSLKAEQLKLNAMFDKNLDLFSTLYSGYGYYISEKLREDFTNAKISGIKMIEPVDPRIIL